MANAIAVDLSPGEVTADGQSDAIDISGARNAVRLTCWRLATTGDGRAIVTLETSADGSSWRSVGSVALGPANAELIGFGVWRYIRVSWQLGGFTAATLSVEGQAESAYCTPDDVTRLSMPVNALEDLTLADRLDACLAASAEAEGYLAAAYTLPLAAWSEDLRLHTAKMAARYMLDRRGWDPEQGRGNVIEVGFDRAIAWLKRVADGVIRPPGMIDSAPEDFEGGSVVVSRPRRY